MTPTTLAAANPLEPLVAEVRKTVDRCEHPDDVIDAVLTALTAAMDPALSERAGEVLEAAAKAQEWMRYPDDAESISLTGLAEWVNRRPASAIPALVSVAQSLLAQNAALRAERDAPCGKCEAKGEDCGEHAPSWEQLAAGWKARAEAAEAQIAALTARVEGLTGALRWAHDTLWEINPSNYDHDDVCKLNDASVEVILGIAPLTGETHGKSPEWWAARAALSTTEEGK